MTINLRTHTLVQLKQLASRIAGEIARRESTGKAAMLRKLTRMAREHGWSLEDVLGDATDIPLATTSTRKPDAAAKVPLPVKYRHPSRQDLTWSGRGRKPQWVEAWTAQGGALDALSTAAEKFARRQRRPDGLKPAADQTVAETTSQASTRKAGASTA